MFRRVAGSGQRPQRQPTEIDLGVIGQRLVRELQATRDRSHDRRATGGKLVAARHEVRMQVGLERVRDLLAAPIRLGQVGHGVTGRVQHEPTPVAQINKVRRVTQTLVDNGSDSGTRHVHPLGFMPVENMRLVF